jgi:curved DNA-binding protein
MSNYYTTLGISQDASQDDIKRAYRKLASQHHPDKGGNVQTFQQIEEAYRILSDPQSRAQYDNPAPEVNFNNIPPNFQDIFQDMFREQSPFDSIFGRRPQFKNKSLNIQTTISLEEALTGKDLMASMKLPSGRDQVIEIKIPAGIRDNTTIKLNGMGDDSIPNLPKGDLNLTVKVANHDRFERQGDDLLTNIEINCIEAMLGKTIEIETLDRKILEVKINPGVQPGQILALQGYGMPNMNDNRFKGRLLLSINVKILTNLTEQQKHILANF